MDLEFFGPAPLEAREIRQLLLDLSADCSPVPSTSELGRNDRDVVGSLRHETRARRSDALELRGSSFEIAAGETLSAGDLFQASVFTNESIDQAGNVPEHLPVRAIGCARDLHAHLAVGAFRP